MCFISFIYFLTNLIRSIPWNRKTSPTHSLVLLVEKRAGRVREPIRVVIRDYSVTVYSIIASPSSFASPSSNSKSPRSRP